MKMIDISYTSKFEKNFKRLNFTVKGKIKQRVEIFQTDPHDPRLKTHKLSGQLKDYYAFSINHSYRILFIFESSNSVTFIDVGTHSVYE